MSQWNNNGNMQNNLEFQNRGGSFFNRSQQANPMPQNRQYQNNQPHRGNQGNQRMNYQQRNNGQNMPRQFQQQPRQPVLPQPMMIPPPQAQGNNQAQPPQNNQNQVSMQPAGPVTYEPLDEKTMEEVRRIIAEKSGTPMPPKDDIFPEIGTAPGDMINPEIAKPIITSLNENEETLREFIQNEHNASRFYEYLAEIAAKDEYATLLLTLSGESAKRSEILSGLHQSMFGNEYAIKKTRVNNSVKFKEGIHWAINVENKALRDISDYYDTINHEAHCRKLHSVMFKKFCDLSSLQIIALNLRSFFS